MSCLFCVHIYRQFIPLAVGVGNQFFVFSVAPAWLVIQSQLLRVSGYSMFWSDSIRVFEQ